MICQFEIELHNVVYRCLICIKIRHKNLFTLILTQHKIINYLTLQTTGLGKSQYGPSQQAVDKRRTCAPGICITESLRSHQPPPVSPTRLPRNGTDRPRRCASCLLVCLLHFTIIETYSINVAVFNENRGYFLRLHRRKLAFGVLVLQIHTELTVVKIRNKLQTLVVSNVCRIKGHIIIIMSI